MRLTAAALNASGAPPQTAVVASMDARHRIASPAGQTMRTGRFAVPLDSRVRTSAGIGSGIGSTAAAMAFPSALVQPVSPCFSRIISPRPCVVAATKLIEAILSRRPRSGPAAADLDLSVISHPTLDSTLQPPRPLAAAEFPHSYMVIGPIKEATAIALPDRAPDSPAIRP